jgi:hypothetical protein
MWDGAGGASRAGWERPGAPARGGTAAGCSPPRRACPGARPAGSLEGPRLLPGAHGRPACCRNRATHILYFPLNTVHLAPTNLHCMVLTLHCLLCTASSTLYPHSTLNTEHPASQTLCTLYHTGYTHTHTHTHTTHTHHAHHPEHCTLHLTKCYLFTHKRARANTHTTNPYSPLGLDLTQIVRHHTCTHWCEVRKPQF